MGLQNVGRRDIQDFTFAFNVRRGRGYHEDAGQYSLEVRKKGTAGFSG